MRRHLLPTIVRLQQSRDLARLRNQAAARGLGGVRCEDQLDGELIEQLLERSPLDLLQGRAKGRQGAALNLRDLRHFIGMTAANAMVLLGGINQVEIDRKGANDING